MKGNCINPSLVSSGINQLDASKIIDHKLIILGSGNNDPILLINGHFNNANRKQLQPPGQFGLVQTPNPQDAILARRIQPPLPVISQFEDFARMIIQLVDYLVVVIAPDGYLAVLVARCVLVAEGVEG
jgi:hypothetical protein